MILYRIQHCLVLVLFSIGELYLRAANLYTNMTTISFLLLATPLLHQDRESPSRRHSPATAKRRAPRRFVRLQPHSDGRTTLLQTAVTTYTAPNPTTSTLKTLHLHSVIHIADAPYYSALQDDLQAISALQSCAVLFELITPSSNTIYSRIPGVRAVYRQTTATSATRQTARALSAVAQADMVDPRKPRWYIADLPSEKLAEIRPQQKSVVSAHSIALRLAAALLPWPELFHLVPPLAPPTVPALSALARMDFTSARRTSYARLVEASTSARTNTATDKRSAARDAAAMETVRRAGLAGIEEVALVYGAWHTGRLCRLVEGELGMRFQKVRWQTAMTLTEDKIRWRNALVGAAVGIAYFCYAGFDWAFTLDGLVAAVEKGQAGGMHVVEMLSWYVVRHFVPYVGLRKWFSVEDVG